MPLSGKKLSQGMKGEEVKLLQFALRQLGHFIPDDELKSSFFGKGTAQAVAAFQERIGLKPTGDIDEVTSKKINTILDTTQPNPHPEPKPDPEPKPKPDDKPQPDGKTAFIVRGQVSKADRRISTGLTVRAFDKDLPSLKSEELLGEAITDNDGRYEIKYTAAQFRRAEKKTADLIVRAFDKEPAPLASSPIIFNAGPEETVDLVVDGAVPSEYERYAAELAPLIENIPVADLTDEDLAFLTGETVKYPKFPANLGTARRSRCGTTLRIYEANRRRKNPQ